MPSRIPEISSSPTWPRRNHWVQRAASRCSMPIRETRRIAIGGTKAIRIAHTRLPCGQSQGRIRNSQRNGHGIATSATAYSTHGQRCLNAASSNSIIASR